MCGSQRVIAWLVNQRGPTFFRRHYRLRSPPRRAAPWQSCGRNRSRRRQVLTLAERLRHELRALGGNVIDSCCHIVPFLVWEARAATRLLRRLQEQGLLVPAIRPPSVPEGTARLRICVTAGHTEQDVMQLVESLRSAWRSDLQTEPTRSVSEDGPRLRFGLGSTVTWRG